MRWKEIDGYEGYYEVSDTGLVRSVDRTITAKNGNKYFHSGRYMKLTLGKGRDGTGGYLVVNLRKNGTSKVVQVHILVAKAFIPNPNNLPTVNHKNGNKTKNDVDNLEWVSYRDNNIHALQHKLRKPRGNPIVQETMDGRIVNCFKSTCEAARLTGVSVGSISHCLNHRTNSAGGFVWKAIKKCNDYPVREYARR